MAPSFSFSLIPVPSISLVTNPGTQVYPKVVVREQQEGFSPLGDGGAFLLPNITNESVSMKDRCFPAPEKDQSDSPVSIVRISKPFASNLTTKHFSASKGALKNSKCTVENTKLHVRAQSVPRPRAVLSSPDNDGMIGKRNKLNNQRSSASKNCNPQLKIPAETKVIANRAKAENHMSIRKGFVGATSNTTRALKQKGLSRIGSPVAKGFL